MALINLRNALMAGKRLPYDAEVEYLEFTGSQYILTGINQYNSLTVKAEMAWMAVSNDATFVGGRGGTTTRNYYLHQTNGVWAIVYGAYTTYNSSVPVAVDDFVSVEAALSRGHQRFSINGVELFTSTDGSNTAYSQNVAIGAMRVGTSTITPCKAKVKWIKIYAGSTLVRDYIPVRKGTVGYLYDRVSGKLFGNAGTGDFTCGPDVVPVEYIDGDNYNLSVGANALCVIDTGIVPNLATDVWECDAQFVRFGATAGCWGRTPNRFAFGRGSASWNDWYFGYGDTNNRTGVAYDTARHIFRLDAPNRTMSVDSATYNGTGNEVSGNDYTLGIFNRNNAKGITSLVDVAESKLYSSKFYRSGVLIQHLIPVRVGTDATSWEGAMMDVLTRRIYRNAGTGAFTYGNDLKYPIPAT